MERKQLRKLHLKLKMRLEVIENGNNDFIVTLEGEFFRHCKTYSELDTTINSLIRSKYLPNAEGMI